MKDKFLLEQKMSEAVDASESESEAYPKEKDKAKISEYKSDESSDSDDRSEKTLDSENGSESKEKDKASGSEDKSDKSSNSEDRSEKALDSENGSEKASGSKDARNCEDITSRPRGSKKKVGTPSRIHANLPTPVRKNTSRKQAEHKQNVPFTPSKIGDAGSTRRRQSYSYEIDTNLDDAWIQDPYVLSPCEMPFHAFSRFGGGM